MNARQFVQQQPVVRQPEDAWGRLASTCSVSASLGGLPLTPRCRQVLVKCILQPAQDTGLQATLDDAESVVLDLLGQGELPAVGGGARYEPRFVFRAGQHGHCVQYDVYTKYGCIE